MTASRLFCFGLGYTASRLAFRLLAEGWAVAGTCRSLEAKAELRELGFDAFLFDGDGPLDDAKPPFGERRICWVPCRPVWAAAEAGVAIRSCPVTGAILLKPGGSAGWGIFRPPGFTGIRAGPRSMRTRP